MPRRRRAVIWSPEAEQDLFDISAYLSAEASALTAEKYLRAINRAGERIRTRPLSGRARDELISGLRSVLVHPYVVFYRTAELSVEIVRVLHQRRGLDAIFTGDIDD
jgi:toxin ParE1/3/4